jgi:hypothetical protein
MYILALEQFEIVPFLALKNLSLSLPNSVISFIFCLTVGFFVSCLLYIFFYINSRKNKLKILSKITDVPGWSDTIDRKNAKIHHRYIYADIYQGKKKSAMVSVDVRVDGWRDIGPASSFIKDVYTKHPFVSSGVPHHLQMLGAYTLKKNGPQTKELGYRIFTSVPFDGFSVGYFFKSSLEGFHKKHTAEGYRLSRVILLLETV